MALPITDALADFFVDTISVQAVTRDGFGKATASGAPVTYKARVVSQHRTFRTKDGQEITSTVKAWVPGSNGFTTLNHEYTLPVRFVPRAPVALHVEHLSDENGGHHEVLHFDTRIGQQGQ